MGVVVALCQVTIPSMDQLLRCDDANHWITGMHSIIQGARESDC